MLEAKYIWNAKKIAILQQEFENFCIIWVVDAGCLWFNSFYFVAVLPCVFCNKFIDSTTFCTWWKFWLF